MKNVVLNALSRHFDKSVNQCSPVVDDFERNVHYDDDGNEFVTFDKVDYPSIQAKNGFIMDWSLDSLMKAGINPQFAIHTGYATRLDGFDELNRIAAAVDSVLDNGDKSNN